MSEYEGPVFRDPNRVNHERNLNKTGFQPAKKTSSFLREDTPAQLDRYQPSYLSEQGKFPISFEQLTQQKQAHDVQEIENLHEPSYQIPYLRAGRYPAGDQLLMAKRMEPDPVETEMPDTSQYNLSALYQRVADFNQHKKQGHQRPQVSGVVASDELAIATTNKQSLNLQKQILVKPHEQEVELTKSKAQRGASEIATVATQKQSLEPNLLKQRAFHNRLFKPVDSYILFEQEDLT